MARKIHHFRHAFQTTVFAVGMAALCLQSPVNAQQLPEERTTPSPAPYQLRPIPGTVMPSLRGTTAQDSNSNSSVFPQSSVGRTRDDTGADDEQVEAQATPIPLTDEPQQRITPQGTVPAVNAQFSDDDVLPPIAQNPREGVVETNPVADVEDDPFGETGFRLGTSIVNLRLEQSIGYSTNLDQTEDGQSGAFSRTLLRGSLVSDWSRHEFSINAEGQYRKAFDSEVEDRPDANIDAALRLDLIDGFTSTIGANYGFTTESLTSDDLGSNVSERPGIHTFGADLTFARTGQRFETSLRGSITRTEFDEAAISDGGVFDQDDRNRNESDVSLRLGYNSGAIVTPFVEAGIGWRRFDDDVDRNGEQRNSMTYDLRGGLAFNNGEKLSGEFAVGYLREEFDEGSFEALEGYSLNGNLVWSPVRETTVTVNAATSLNSSTNAGDNGSILYTAGIDLTRRATERLTLNVNGNVALDVDEDNDETDTTWTAGIGAQYWLNRYTALTADLDHIQFEDGDDEDSYSDTMATIGIILQR